MSNQRIGFGGALNGMTKSHLLNLFISDQLKFNNGGDLISWDLQEALNDDFVISRDGTDILTLTPTGDLTVIGSISTDCISDVDGTTRVCIADVTDVITMETNSLERMRIDTAGLVGIGTNNPIYPLQVEKDSEVIAFFKRLTTAGNGVFVDISDNVLSTTQARLRIGFDTRDVPLDNIPAAQVLADEGAGNLLLSSRTDLASGIKFYTNAGTAAVERMIILSNGNVGINDSSPTNQLDVTGNINTTEEYYVDDVEVLSTDTLGGGVFNSSLTNVGTLTSLTMGGDIAMGTNDITGATNITATNLTGTLQTAAQPNITSASLTANAGNLTNTGTLIVTDDLTVDTNTLFVDASLDRVGINTITPSQSLDVVGNVNITEFLLVDPDDTTFIVDSTNHRVGVGTFSPAVPLDVVGATNISGTLKLTTVDTSVTNNSNVPIAGDIAYGQFTRGTQVITTGTATNVDYDTAVFNRGTFVESFGAFTVPATGLYQVNYYIQWGTETGNTRTSLILFNGETHGRSEHHASSLGVSDTGSAVLNIENTANSFSISCFQDSGGDRTLQSSRVTMARMGNCV